MNKFRLVLRKLTKARFFVGLFFAGLIFLIVGIVFLAMPKTTTETATATVLHIDQELVGEDYQYKVDLEYTDKDGNVYDVTTAAYDSSWKEGSKVEIKYDPANPGTISIGSDSNFIIYVAIGVGAVAAVAGAVKSVMVIMTPSEETNEFNKVNMDGITEEQKAEIADSNEPQQKYVFHFTTGLKTNYVMETDPGKQVVKEAISQNLSIVTSFKYNFINRLTGKEELKTCSHTVTTDYGEETGLMMETDAKFKIDGVLCWDALGKLGYSFEPHVKDLHMSFDIMKYGVKVAYIEHTGTNAMTGKNYKWGNIATPGIYAVSCRPSDIDGVFMTCFIIARTYDYR